MQHLVKYISKAEPSFNIDLPNNALDPEVIYEPEWLGQLGYLSYLWAFTKVRWPNKSSFYQQRLTQNSVLKYEHDLLQLQEGSSDIKVW